MHDGAHTGGFLGLRMLRPIQAGPVTVVTLGNLQRFVIAPIFGGKQCQQAPVRGARARQQIDRHGREKLAIRLVSLFPALQADQPAHHFLAGQPARVTGRAGAGALQHFVGQACCRKSRLVLLG